MEPGMSEELRPWTWRPGMPMAARTVAMAAGWAALVMLGALAIGSSELHVWEEAIALALLGVSVAGVFMARWRAHVEPRLHWSLLSVAFAASGVAQLFVILGQSRINEHELPSIADITFLLFQVLVAVFFLQHVHTGNRFHFATHLCDALLLTMALTFLLWELVLRHDLGELSRLSGTTQVLVVLDPFLDLFVFSLLVLLLLVDRSPARVMSLLGASALAAGDVFTGGAVNVERGRLVLGGLSWILGVLALVIAMAVPAGRRVEPLRPTLPRLALVHGTVTVGLWVAIWKYVLHDQPPTVVTVVVVLFTGLFWTSTQIAWHRLSGDWANRLNGSIVELQQTQDEMRELLDDLPAAVVVLARDGRIREVNAQTTALTGLDDDDMVGHYFTEMFSADDRDALVNMWNEVHTGAAVENPTLTLTRPNGSIVLLEVDSNLPLRNPNRVVLALRDVTQRVMEANRLERARERFRLAFHGAPTGMALSSAAGGTILDVNDSLVRMLARDRDDLIGRTIEEISHPDDWQRTITMLNRGGDQDLENYRVERRYLRGDGGVVWARTWVSVMDDGDGGSLAISHIEDVTEQRHNEERLEWAASHDGLTGLPNRFSFLERLGVYLQTAEPGSIAVLFIDLDNFKVINDSMGHGAGDQLLQAMSERLRSIVRDRDMLGRFGGDEFIVLLRDIGGGHNPQDVAERLREEIARPMEIDGAEFYVTASIGITLSDRPGITTSEMLRDADAAMYRAKERGRDCVEVFAPGSHDATVLTLRTTNELRRALERSEIVPYYQPIVQLGDGKLVGFEVLARWRHPDRGLLAPEQFLPMAEETGLISDVGAEVLRASLVQLGRWRLSDPRFSDLTVSVNVSVRQLMSSQFVDVVARAMSEGGVPAGALWLEITESALMSDVKVATVALRELRSLGLHLAVDDFGTGYSSLTSLRRFPVEAIKVDRGFINGLGIDAEDSTIVEAVINLGHSLGLSVVAEGVETPLQLSRLRELNCDRGQGYLFGRPRPAELVEAEYSLG